jgi:hypothetical protein
VIMQLLRPEDSHVQYFALFSPILILGLSALVVTAALAVLFETVPGLRSGLGNVIYFFVWMGLMIAGSSRAAATHSFSDYTGIATVLGQMQAQVHQFDPRSHGGAALSFGFGGVRLPTRIFPWTGMHWDDALILGRVLWLGIAAGITLLAAVCFDRFDGARAPGTAARKPQPAGSLDTGGSDNDGGPDYAAVQAERRFVRVHLTALPAIGPRGGVLGARFGALVMAELRLLLRGRGWWWYVVAAGLFIACLAAPLTAARSGIIAAAWLWPVLLWSQMGTREAQFSTRALVFSGPRAFPRQLLAAWAAGVGVAALTGGGLGLHLLMAGNFAALTAWAAAACFIPALALALGVCSESRKTFEAVYTVWWYFGPLQHIPKLDFIGTSPASSTPGLYWAASAVLVAAACLWRRARLAYA